MTANRLDTVMATRNRAEQQHVRCAIYCRVSTAGQINGSFTSLDNQKEYCEAFIKSQEGKGWHCVPQQYVDPGFSGTTLERPGLQLLLADVDAGKIDTVVVYRFDRISRSTRDFHNLIDHLDVRGVTFVSVSEQINTAEPSGQVMRTMMVSFAQFERDVIAQRTRDKIAGAKKQGRWCGGLPPLGYQVHEDGGRIVVDPGAGKMVKTIFALYLKHKSLMAVAEELNRRGWLTKRHVSKTGNIWGGKTWTKTHVHNHLTNPVYLGLVKHKDKTYPGEHKSIITKRTWNMVQGVLKANSRCGGAMVKNIHSQLLRDLVFCKACGTPMKATSSRRDGKVYRYLVCASATSNGWQTCPHPSVSAPKMEAFVRDKVMAIGADPVLQEETVHQTQRTMKSSRPALKAERKQLQIQLSRARNEIGHLVNTLGSGQAVSVTDRLKELEGRAGTVEQRLEEVAEELQAIETSAVDTESLAIALSEFTPVWDLLFPMEQERIIQLLVERIDFDGEGGKLAITYRPAGIVALAGEITEGQEDVA